MDSLKDFTFFLSTGCGSAFVFIGEHDVVFVAIDGVQEGIK